MVNLKGKKVYLCVMYMATAFVILFAAVGS